MDREMIVERTWQHAGFTCAVVLHDRGQVPDDLMPDGLPLLQRRYRTAYVLIPEGHPWHKTGKSDDAEVHGGVTWAGELTTMPGFWVGADFDHYRDTIDYWTLDRVSAEIETLADQAAAAVDV